MKRVDSDALSVANRSLGLSGQGAAETEFFDGELYQVLDVSGMVRRGRTQAQTGGIYTGVMSNVHTAAETLNSNITPYAIGAGLVFAPYPDPVPVQFDVWLIAAAVEQQSGTGTFRGVLQMDPVPSQQGFGVNNSGNQVTRTTRIALAFWDSILSIGDSFGLANGVQPWQKIGFRIPRSVATLRFTSVSSAIATFDCQVMLGIFPTSLGQDVLI